MDTAHGAGNAVVPHGAKKSSLRKVKVVFVSKKNKAGAKDQTMVGKESAHPHRNDDDVVDGKYIYASYVDLRSELLRKLTIQCNTHERVDECRNPRENRWAETCRWPALTAQPKPRVGQIVGHDRTYHEDE